MKKILFEGSIEVSFQMRMAVDVFGVDYLGKLDPMEEVSSFAILLKRKNEQGEEEQCQIESQKSGSWNNGIIEKDKFKECRLSNAMHKAFQVILEKIKPHLKDL